MSLDRFVTDAERRVAAGAYDVDADLKPHGRLAGVIRRGAVIAELKPRSPSEGRLLHRPAQVVLDAYRRGGAAALSILTDADHFDGSPDLLIQAHRQGLPTLMKDFIVDERQLDCAARCGASAVLLIERCLTPDRRDALIEAAHARGLEVLLEVFDAAERDRAIASEADLIGVNARDLDTLRVDPDTARALLAGIDRPSLLLSGIQDRADQRAAMAAGADGVLVGSHLVRAPDPALWLTALRRPLAKVCGIANANDLATAIDAGADLVGFVTGADTPRSIPPIQVQRLVDEARAAGVPSVLVTPHADAYEVREWCRLARPDWVQVHGFAPDEAWIHSLGAIPTRVLTTQEPHIGDGRVLDHPSGGGSGQTHDWEAARLARQAGLSLIAGGLDASNAADAVAATGAWGADASSRLEATPGRKDPQAVAAFVAAVQGADA